METVCVCALSSVLCAFSHTHTLSMSLHGVIHVPVGGLANESWCLSPSKSEQLLRDLAPHPGLSRSGTQWLLSYSLIPLWFILVLFAFPECNSICFSVLRSFPSPVLCQYNITHLSTGTILHFPCVSLFVFWLVRLQYLIFSKGAAEMWRLYRVAVL